MSLDFFCTSHSSACFYCALQANQSQSCVRDSKHCQPWQRGVAPGIAGGDAKSAGRCARQLIQLPSGASSCCCHLQRRDVFAAVGTFWDSADDGQRQLAVRAACADACADASQWVKGPFTWCGTRHRWRRCDKCWTMCGAQAADGAQRPSDKGVMLLLLMALWCGPCAAMLDDALGLGS
jgi:hypothetical protein